MSNIRVKPDELGKAIAQIVTDYADVTSEDCAKAVEEVSKEVVSELHGVHPAGSGKYGSWDAYNKSWKSRKETKDKYYHKKATIYNEKYYRLTHLLEKGHALPQGGRSQAFPHIAPIAEKAEELLYNRIKNGI